MTDNNIQIYRTPGGLNEDIVLPADFDETPECFRKIEDKPVKRGLGVFSGEQFYMADDFDDTPDCLKEYVK